MALTLVATAGASNANSYLTRAEAESYFEGHLYASAWLAAAEPDVALVMATRVMNRMLQPRRVFIKSGSYYLIRPEWSGAPATTTQALAWPRTGMYDANGNEISSSVIPQTLKEATAELALALLTSNRTADNVVAARGITSFRAGPVSFTFKDDIEVNVLPDSVLYMLPPSWFTEEAVEYAQAEAEFEVI